MADSARTEDSVAKITQGTGESAKNIKSMAEDSKTLRENLEAVAKFGSNTVAGTRGGANSSSSQTPTTATGFGSGGGGGFFGSGQTPYQSAMPAGQSYSGGGGFGRSMVSLGNILSNAADFALAGADIFPTTQEALYTDLYTNRLRFYGGSNNVNRLNEIGTATSPLDALMAAGSGAAMGLLPGLSNYSSQNFGGITGGAALLSNLVPGAGLQAGMTGMAALNQAGNVNRLRMLGINVRSQDGKTMNDLPQIIEQLYNLMKQSAGGPFTAEDVAVSAMSGNALDSMLNQYFPGDPTLRQGIIAGLIQRAGTKGKEGEYLGLSGTQAELEKRGAFTKSAGGISARNAAEYNMISGTLLGNTLQGMNRANDVLRATYQTLAGGGTPTGFGRIFDAGTSFLAETKSAYETLAGGRSGAVGGMFDALANLGSGVGGGIGQVVTSLITEGIKGGLLVNANEGGRVSGAGVVDARPTVNVYMKDTFTEADAKTLGLTIGNEINKELLVQLAAART